MTKSSYSTDGRRRSRRMARPTSVTSKDVSAEIDTLTELAGAPVPEHRRTKALLVRELLRRPHGAQIDDLCEATGWLPLSCRAYLTGMRKKGAHIVRESLVRGRSVYRLVATTEEA